MTPDITMFYNLLNYNIIYIVFKKDCRFGDWNTFVHYDQKKERYFYRGRIIKFELSNWNGAVIKSYPEEGKLSIIEETCLPEFNAAKNQSEKANLIISIPIDTIDYIIAPILH